MVDNLNVLFNNDYLNRTVNKSERGANPLPSFIVWHSTESPNPENSLGTLNYNLNNDPPSSYNFLIAMDGTVYNYVDVDTYVAWHAGAKSKALGFEFYEVNVHSIGIELDTGTGAVSIPDAQFKAAVSLLKDLHTKYNIPLDDEHNLGHKDICEPGYKSDPEGYNPHDIVSTAYHDLYSNINVVPVTESPTEEVKESPTEEKVEDTTISKATNPWPRTLLGANGKEYYCGEGIFSVYQALGVHFAGLPLSDEEEYLQSGVAGCTILKCENLIIKYNPSLQGQWALRPMSLLEAVTSKLI